MKLIRLQLLILFLSLTSCSLFKKEVRFDKANSPHLISENLTLEKGVSFIVEPGTVLRIDTGVTIKSYGDIIMEGTAEEPIIIEPVVPKIGWKRFHLKGENKRVILKHCSITDGHLTSFNNTNLIENCTFKNDQALTWETAMIRFWHGSLTVRNSSFLGNNKGEGILVHETNNPLVENCSFKYVPDAVEYISSEGGRILNNTFSYCNDDAIDLNNCKQVVIEGNKILESRDAAFEVGSEGFGSTKEIRIARNVVRACKKGLWLKESSEVKLLHNSFIDNTKAIHVVSSADSSAQSYVYALNNIFYQNSADIRKDERSLALFEYNLTDRSPLPGESNLVGKPLFVRKGEDQFCLSKGSPARDAGDPKSPKDADGTNADLGALPYAKN